MTFSFRPATREGVGLFIAIAGSSRTGKTFTGLRIARGIAGPEGKIAAIDTEGKRMSHYAPPAGEKADSEKGSFAFDAYNMPSPFGGYRFLEAARGAQEAGYSALVIDSFSLEWSGAGGVLAERERQWAEANYAQKMSDQIWNRVKGPGSEHKLMMDGFMQLTIPVIFCLRANEVADHLGGGWKVDQDKRFLYEWTVGLTLHPDSRGAPNYKMFDAKKKPLWKVSDQHKHIFPEGQLITEQAGAELQAWRNSDAARQTGGGIGAPKRTFEDWILDLETDLEEASTEEEAQVIAARDTVQKMLGSDKVPTDRKNRINAAIKATLVRFEEVPGFAKGAVV